MTNITGGGPRYLGGWRWGARAPLAVSDAMEAWTSEAGREMGKRKKGKQGSGAHPGQASVCIHPSPPSLEATLPPPFLDCAVYSWLM